MTLAGESSGSVGSCILAFSPLSKGLFRRLGLQSGICTGPWMGPDPSREASFNVSAAFAADVGCRSLAELRAAPASRLLNSTLWTTPNFGIDGFLLPVLPAALPAPLVELDEVLLGGNTEDTTCATVLTEPLPPKSGAALRSQLADYFGDDVETVLASYLDHLAPPQDESDGGRRAMLGHAAAAAAGGDSGNASVTLRPIRDADAPFLWINMSRDAGVTCPSLWLARRLVANGTTPYLYRFGFNSTHPGEPERR